MPHLEGKGSDWIAYIYMIMGISACRIFDYNIICNVKYPVSLKEIKFLFSKTNKQTNKNTQNRDSVDFGW